MNKDVFAGVVVPLKDFPGLPPDERPDLFQNPVLSAILCDLYIPDDSLKDFVRHIESSPERVNRQLSSISQHPYRFLLSQKWRSRMQTLMEKDKKETATSLQKAWSSHTRCAIPLKYSGKSPLAAINYVPDDFHGIQNFSIKHEKQPLRLFTAGQLIHDTHPSDNAWGADYIELRFNRTEKKNNPDRGRSFKFYYHHPVLNGHRESFSSFPFAFADPKDGMYSMECFIPWDTLGFKGYPGADFQFEIRIQDCDANPLDMESQIIGSSGMILSRKVIRSSSADNRIYVPYSSDSLTIDGRQDSLWKYVMYKDIRKLHKGDRIESDRDLQAKYKLAWDEKGLYAYVQVHDQVKQRPWYIPKDYCRITNRKTGELVWKVTGQPSALFPAYYSDQAFTLDPGEYQLEYISDSKFSLADWLGYNPPLDFYGALLYLEND